MKNNRRDFLKKTGFAGLGLAGTIGCTRQPDGREPFPKTHKQTFNMSGYVAPKLDVVRIGVIGLGNRGSGTMIRLGAVEGVEIKALCDLEPERVTNAKESIRPLGHNPDSYSGGEEEWKKVCDRKDIDLIAVVTPWDLHTPMCVYAMEHEKHAYTELPAATTMEDCWKLVETSERTRKHCVQMSMSCHGFGGGWSKFNLDVVLNMARKGFFGELIHAEGAYIHDLLLNNIFSKTNYYDLWRLKENIGIHGNLYPQHGLVPILQIFDINYGDKMDYMSSLSSDDFRMADTAKKLAAEDDFWKPYVGKDFRGNINTSIIRTNKGRTIMMQHDVSSPRPDVRFNIISGSKGIYNEGGYKDLSRIATSHEDWLSDEEFRSLLDQYTPEMTKVFRELFQKANKEVRGGRSYARVSPTDWRLVDCLRSGLPMDMDVYEAAASSSIIPLSAWSVANRSTSVTVPDFTSGAWKTNIRGMDIELERGRGTTKLL